MYLCVFYIYIGRSRYLINPNDMWGLHSNVREDSSLEWRLLGGEQAWAALSAEAFTATMVAGQLASPDFKAGSLKVAWPLGRHDSHSWVLDGDILLFSGAMDLYRRNPSACARGESCMVKNSYLLRDWWTRPLLSLRDNLDDTIQDHVTDITWARGSSLSTSSSVAEQQPGPRVHGATWTNTISTNRYAWLFGGIGLLVSIEGRWQVAVVPPTDTPLQRLCDMWRYDLTLPLARRWQLVGSCSDNTAELAQHGLAPSGTSADVLAHSTGLDGSLQTRMLLREAVLATAWVDSDQNLWLYGGARCADGLGGIDCGMAVLERLNPAARSVTGGNPATSEQWRAAIASQPCSNDLWRFDIEKLTWSAYTYTEYAHSPSTAAIASSWPEAECGAVALAPSPLEIPGQVSTSDSVARMMLGGWRGQLFSPCQNSSSGSAGALAVCSSGAWGVEQRDVANGKSDEIDPYDPPKKRATK